MRDTRERLLESACEVFAEKGFHDANVAEICERANANIASINYHFGGKKKLYREVLKYAIDAAEREYPLLFKVSEVPAAEERLARFIRAQFVRGSCDGPAGCFDRMVVHELITPSALHRELFEKLMRPRREYLFSLLRELLPAGVSEAHVWVCVHNVVSLFAFRNFHQANRQHRHRIKAPPLPSPDKMAHFAVVFALGGIRAIAHEASVDSHSSPPRPEKKGK